MLINMRNALMAGGGGWKNPYVTDGLVAMWDGEWNAGMGIHDPEATIWKDISGNGYDLTGHLTSYSHWENDSMFFFGNESPPTYFSLDSESKSSELYNNAKSFCITIKGSTLSGNGQTIVMTGNDKSLEFAPVKFSRVGLGHGSNRGITFTDVGNWHSFYYEYDTDVVMIDNISYTCDRWSGNMPSSSIMKVGGTGLAYQGLRGNIGNLKLYSCKLTPQEIAHNYAVDKARFNLPDAT